MAVVKHRLFDLKNAKERVEKRTIPQSEIAEVAQISQATISRLLENEVISEINAKTMTGLCRYFDCGIADLLVIDWELEGVSELA